MDIILYNIAAGLVCLIFGYFFGSIPFAILIGKIFYKQDPRKAGSNNAGATNMGRVFGKKAFIVVLILDFLKAILPIWICYLVLTFVPFGNNTLLPTVKEWISNGTGDHILVYPAYWLCALGVTLGHCYPIFANFKGGKGAANFAGIAIGTTWLYLLLPLVVFAILIKKVKIMSLSVLISFGLYAVIAWIFTILLLTNVLPSWMYYFGAYGPTLQLDITYVSCFTVMYIILVARHHENIKRLKEGTEKVFKMHKSN